jgi:hypothetical protein
MELIVILEQEQCICHLGFFGPQQIVIMTIHEVEH